MKHFHLLASALAAALLGVAGAQAAICPSYPYTLTNGQNADANQVMSNFSSILSCVNSGAAGRGANFDITSLNSLSTPLSVAQGGTGGTTAPLFAANNLSDLAAAATARTNLGVGYGTTAGTVAQGNDTRITGALQAANNLSDVGAAATARTNLGLGGAAVLNVGTGSSTVAAGNDSRFYGPTQNSQSAGYTLVLADAGGQVYHPSADVTARTWVIPANASVAYGVGTKIEIVNDCSAGAITLNITTDTLVWFPSGTVGSGRTIAACGVASLTKVGTTRWALWGTGVS